MLRHISCRIPRKIALRYLSISFSKFKQQAFSSKMSWMDSWSRPSKHQATPPPLYLVQEDTPYCKSCGRVIGSRKTQTSSTPAKYCSAKCRSRKPGKIDREIEETFVAFLSGSQDVSDLTALTSSAHSKGKLSKRVKGDPRLLIPLTTVETAVFGDRHDPEKVFGRGKNRARRGVSDEEVWKSVDMVDDPEPEVAARDAEEIVDGDLLARLSIRSGTRIRPSQDTSEVNGGVGGEKGRAERIEETDDMLQKRMEGMKRMHEREMVRCAARRGIAFGFLVKGEGDDKERRKCEAVMQGKVVESSFAKGDWSIRWRE